MYVFENNIPRCAPMWAELTFVCSIYNCDKVNNVTVRYDEGYILQTNYMHNLKTYLIDRIHVVTFNYVTIKSWFQRTKTKL